ncbi:MULTISPECIES: DUF3618 domain-containing protein [Actinoplanes]|uniref:DUF3618 domain-containing protein n=1 Tax=Actinoplanes TaxID=1865 RepID=UPI000697D319|nr:MULTISPECIES: DUF3618 domain-containing protein [Actinoplanes]GLY00658.1 hypothetical protein Acsp01_10370 [Actinoplanes sp. NBRC 101535]
MATSIPTGQEQLTDEIKRTRADLGDTVEALAAKTDITGRAKQAAGETVAQAKQTLAAAGTTTARVAGSTRERLAVATRRPTVRKALPVAAVAAVLGAAAVLIQQRRAAARRASSGPAAWFDRFR